MNIVYTNEFDPFIAELTSEGIQFEKAPRMRIDTVEEAEDVYGVTVTFTALVREDGEAEPYLLQYQQRTGEYREHDNPKLATTAGEDLARELCKQYEEACTAKGRPPRIGKLERY